VGVGRWSGIEIPWEKVRRNCDLGRRDPSSDINIPLTLGEHEQTVCASEEGIGHGSPAVSPRVGEGGETGVAIAGVSQSGPSLAVRAFAAERAVAKEKSIRAQRAVVVNRVDHRHVDLLHPTAPEVREQIVDVDDVRLEAADCLKRIGAAAGRNSKGGADRIEQAALEVIGVRGEELDLVAGASQRLVLGLDNRVLAARLARGVEAVDEGDPHRSAGWWLLNHS